MEPNQSNPNQNQSPIPPAGFSSQPNQFSQSSPTQPANTAQSTASNLSVYPPVLSPTHFDNRPTMDASPEATISTPPTPPSKKSPVLVIIMAIFMVVGLGAGIFGLVNTVSLNDKLNETTNTLSNKNAIIAKLAETSGQEINSPEDVPVYKPTKDFIYLGSWDIKLKIPSDLSKVSYILNSNGDYHSSICFNALKTGIQYYPSFANPQKNLGGMGCLHRINNDEGDSDANTGMSFGTKVYTFKDYSYFYTAPSKVFSTDEAEKALEATSVQIVKNMLTANVSSYK